MQSRAVQCRGVQRRAERSRAVWWRLEWRGARSEVGSWCDWREGRWVIVSGRVSLTEPMKDNPGPGGIWTEFGWFHAELYGEQNM